MTPSDQLNQDFQKYLQQPLGQWNWAEGALLIARQEYPALDGRKYLDQIREMGRSASRNLGAFQTIREKVEGLNRFFFGELGFSGNEAEYYDPKNSYLPDLLERKRGIPITLSALYLSLAWESGLPLVGVNFPGHFLAAWKPAPGNGEEPFYIDAFDQGRILAAGDLDALLEKRVGPGNRVDPALHLRNAGVQEILHRMLANLKVIHAVQGRMERALWAAEWMLKLKVNDWDSLRDMGMFYYSMGRLEEAEEALMKYLAETKRPADYPQVWQVLYMIQGQNPARFN